MTIKKIFFFTLFIFLTLSTYSQRWTAKNLIGKWILIHQDEPNSGVNINIDSNLILHYGNNDVPYSHYTQFLLITSKNKNPFKFEQINNFQRNVDASILIIKILNENQIEIPFNLGKSHSKRIFQKVQQ